LLSPPSRRPRAVRSGGSPVAKWTAVALLASALAIASCDGSGKITPTAPLSLVAGSDLEGRWAGTAAVRLDRGFVYWGYGYGYFLTESEERMLEEIASCVDGWVSNEWVRELPFAAEIHSTTLVPDGPAGPFGACSSFSIGHPSEGSDRLWATASCDFGLPRRIDCPTGDPEIRVAPDRQATILGGQVSGGQIHARFVQSFEVHSTDADHHETIALYPLAIDVVLNRQ